LLRTPSLLPFLANPEPFYYLGCGVMGQEGAVRREEWGETRFHLAALIIYEFSSRKSVTLNPFSLEIPK
jgi:hypothetical protein